VAASKAHHCANTNVRCNLFWRATSSQMKNDKGILRLDKRKIVFGLKVTSIPFLSSVLALFDQ
jgi:hypothetical protein